MRVIEIPISALSYAARGSVSGWAKATSDPLQCRAPQARAKVKTDN